MKTIKFVPGAVAFPNAITIPASAPDIFAVLGAEITRLPVALCNLAAHPDVDIIAAIDDHPVHSHDLGVGIAGMVGGGYGASAGGNDFVDGGGQVIPAADPTGVVDNALPQDHIATAIPVVHGAGADPVVAAVPTIITTRTFSLDVNTLVGDLLTLAYLEVGERVLVS